MFHIIPNSSGDREERHLDVGVKAFIAQERQADIGVRFFLASVDKTGATTEENIVHDKHLESFIIVAETGSFSAAADKLYISRTALIQQINLLEERVGVRLLLRHSKGVTLTAAGKYFIMEAKKIVRISQRTLQRCQAMQQNNKVRIGTLPNFAPAILPDICRQFRKIHPEHEVQFVEYHLEEYFQRFQENMFDITTEYLSGYIFDHPDYRILKLLEDKHCCGVPRNHPLSEKSLITTEDLAGQSIVMYARGITRADDKLRDHLLRHVLDIDIIDINTYDRALPLKCELSNHILIYYSMYWENFAPLITVPLEIGISFPIDIGLGYKADSSPAVGDFISVAKSVYTAERQK